MSEEIKQDEKITIKDSKGRTLTLREPELLEMFDIVELLGDKAENNKYVQMLNPLLWIKEIDGQKINTPVTFNELQFLIKRIGTAGHYAALNYLNGKVMKSIEEQIASAKKSPETQELSSE